MTLPLTGLRVIELHAIGPIPFVGMQLRRLGATVTRVVPPKDRSIGLSLDARSDLLNHGKPVLVLDLKRDDERSHLHEALGDSDILLEGFRPGVLERLDLAPGQLVQRYPRMVIGRLSGFGRHGVLAGLAGHDINYLALSGVLSAIGTRDRPVIPLNLIADFGGGAMHLLMGILAALVRRGIDGRGGVVDTSILAGTLGLTPMFHGLLAGDHWRLDRESNLLDGGAPFYRVYATSDERYVAVGALEGRFFRSLLELLDLQERIDAEQQYDRATWPDMARRLAEAFRSKPRAHWAACALSVDCCLTPVLDFSEALNLDAHRDNGWIDEHPYPHVGTVVDVD